MPKPSCVLAWSEEVSDGELGHYVSLGDSEGEPIGHVWLHDTPRSADRHMMRLAKLHRAEPVSDLIWYP